jgi:hypothetical protein
MVDIGVLRRYIFVDIALYIRVNNYEFGKHGKL